MDLVAMLDRSAFGMSVATWRPDNPREATWVYVNQRRCEMSGHTKAEILSSSPVDMIARESLAMMPNIVGEVMEHGTCRFESMLLHKDKSVTPVEVHFTLLSPADPQYVLAEYRDMSREKQTEAHLDRMQENTRDMLSVLEREKEQLRDNMSDNLGQAVIPLLDLLLDTPPPRQKEIVTLIKTRIGHVSREHGLKALSQVEGVELTRRQRMICEMVRNGLTTKSIARILGCSPRTIDNHRTTIRKKLGLAGTATTLDAFLSA